MPPEITPTPGQEESQEKKGKRGKGENDPSSQDGAGESSSSEGVYPSQEETDNTPEEFSHPKNEEDTAESVPPLSASGEAPSFLAEENPPFEFDREMAAGFKGKIGMDVEDFFSEVEENLKPEANAELLKMWDEFKDDPMILGHKTPLYTKRIQELAERFKNKDESLGGMEKSEKGVESQTAPKIENISDTQEESSFEFSPLISGLLKKWTEVDIQELFKDIPEDLKPIAESESSKLWFEFTTSNLPVEEKSVFYANKLRQLAEDLKNGNVKIEEANSSEQESVPSNGIPEDFLNFISSNRAFEEEEEVKESDADAVGGNKEAVEDTVDPALVKRATEVHEDEERKGQLRSDIQGEQGEKEDIRVEESNVSLGEADIVPEIVSEEINEEEILGEVKEEKPSFLKRIFGKKKTKEEKEVLADQKKKAKEAEKKDKKKGKDLKKWNGFELSAATREKLKNAQIEYLAALSAFNKIPEKDRTEGSEQNHKELEAQYFAVLKESLAPLYAERKQKIEEVYAGVDDFDKKFERNQKLAELNSMVARQFLRDKYKLESEVIANASKESSSEGKKGLFARYMRMPVWQRAAVGAAIGVGITAAGIPGVVAGIFGLSVAAQTIGVGFVATRLVSGVTGAYASRFVNRKLGKSFENKNLKKVEGELGLEDLYREKREVGERKGWEDFVQEKGITPEEQEFYVVAPEPRGFLENLSQVNEKYKQMVREELSKKHTGQKVAQALGSMVAGGGVAFGMSIASNLLEHALMGGHIVSGIGGKGTSVNEQLTSRKPSVTNSDSLNSKGGASDTLSTNKGTMPETPTGKGSTPSVEQVDPTLQAKLKVEQDLSQLSVSKKGEGAWQPVYRQFEYRLKADPKAFGLTAEDLGDPAKIKQVLNAKTAEALVKNHLINPDGTELRLARPGAAIRVQDDGTISFTQEDVYQYKPVASVEPEHVETTLPDTNTIKPLPAETIPTGKPSVENLTSQIEEKVSEPLSIFDTAPTRVPSGSVLENPPFHTESILLKNGTVSFGSNVEGKLVSVASQYTISGFRAENVLVPNLKEQFISLHPTMSPLAANLNVESMNADAMNIYTQTAIFKDLVAEGHQREALLLAEHIKKSLAMNAKAYGFDIIKKDFFPDALKTLLNK